MQLILFQPPPHFWTDLKSFDEFRKAKCDQNITQFTQRKKFPQNMAIMSLLCNMNRHYNIILERVTLKVGYPEIKYVQCVKLAKKCFFQKLFLGQDKDNLTFEELIINFIF